MNSVWRTKHGFGNLHGQCCVWLRLEIKDEDKARWSATRSGCYSCAATGNELRVEADEVDGGEYCV